jgi:hypothetical protein
VFCFSQSRKFAGEAEKISRPLPGLLSQRMATRSGSSKLRGFSSTAFTTLKMAVVEPIARPRATMAVRVTAGR